MFFRLIRLSVLLSLSELKEKKICLGMIPTRASLRLNGSVNPAIYRWSLRDCRLGQSGSPRSGKRTDSLVKVENSHAVPVVAS